MEPTLEGTVIETRARTVEDTRFQSLFRLMFNVESCTHYHTSPRPRFLSV